MIRLRLLAIQYLNGQISDRDLFIAAAARAGQIRESAELRFQFSRRISEELDLLHSLGCDLEDLDQPSRLDPGIIVRAASMKLSQGLLTALSDEVHSDVEVRTEMNATGNYTPMGPSPIQVAKVFSSLSTLITTIDNGGSTESVVPTLAAIDEQIQVVVDAGNQQGPQWIEEPHSNWYDLMAVIRAMVLIGVSAPHRPRRLLNNPG